MSNCLILTAVIASLLGIVPQHAVAYSPIFNVDSWEKSRLRDAGIVVKRYRHSMQTESPPRNWVMVQFDCSGIAKGNPVLLTSEIRTPETAIRSARVERTEANEDSLTLRLTLHDILLKKSYVEIVVWYPTKEGGHDARGYRLSYNRLAELAGPPMPAQLVPSAN